MSDNIILLVVIVILIVIILCLITKKNKEPFKTYGGYSPMCPFKSNDGCAWSKEGTGPMCQIDKSKAGCPACCGNIDWYLGPKGYKQKCPDSVPPAFKDAKDYYASIQENFISK